MVSNVKVLLCDFKNGTGQALQSPFTVGNSFFNVAVPWLPIKYVFYGKLNAP